MNAATEALLNSPSHRKSATDVQPATNEKPAETTDEAKKPETIFPDLESLVKEYAHQVGKGKESPFKVSVGAFSRYVWATSTSQARGMVCDARACTNDEIIAAMAANIPKQ